MVTTTNPTGPGSLALAVQQADSDHSGEAITIDFAAASGQTFATPQTIKLGGTLRLNNTTGGETIEIDGPAAGVTIVGGGSTSNFSAIEVDLGTTAMLKGLSITGGHARSGGGISNSGTLTVTNCNLTGNSAMVTSRSGWHHYGRRCDQQWWHPDGHQR